ncbi:hypothetical protein JGB77_24705 [Salmonella enterica subsp. enterica serovar Bovismorbificans]|nr:hypothetical protein [Salmonella enterica subsp. enterica serovar Bovismorbificans]
MYKIEYNKLHASFLDSLLFVPIVHFATVRFASIPSINQYNKFQHHKDNNKNQQDTKTPSISTSSPLFCAFAQKIKIPNKLNHLPHQLQGRQQIKQGAT